MSGSKIILFRAVRTGYQGDLAEVTNSNDGFVKQSCYPFFRYELSRFGWQPSDFMDAMKPLERSCNSCDSRDARRRLASEISGLWAKAG